MAMMNADVIATELRRLLDERCGVAAPQIVVREEIPARVRFVVEADGEAFDFSIAMDDMPTLTSYISEKYLRKVAKRIAGG